MLLFAVGTGACVRGGGGVDLTGIDILAPGKLKSCSAGFAILLDEFSSVGGECSVDIDMKNGLVAGRAG